MKQRYFRQHGGLLLFEEMKSKQGLSFTLFTKEELEEATDKFDERHVLGKGGNGTVYKGALKDKRLVARETGEGVWEGDAHLVPGQPQERCEAIWMLP